jgi:hypothetical protein
MSWRAFFRSPDGYSGCAGWNISWGTSCNWNHHELFGCGCLAPMGTSSNAQFSHSILNFAYYDAYQTLTRVQILMSSAALKRSSRRIVSVVSSKEMLIANSSMTRQD